MYYHSDELRVEASGIMNGPGRPHQSSLELLTSYCLLIMGTALSAPRPARVMRALHANPPIYADILILDTNTPMITVGYRLSGRPTEHCLDDSAHSQLEFMILIDF